ncbi:hypothetical protein MUN81_06185 [Hymenobacter sp. 5317J-9]|uniref:hypothetical protein n=1 Tax=Hymenobacter sp. 5317J-9 TaxID=2932250 RepID=UPI001FD6E8F2|nr:hypothetical protein [Hymenobacter sp. 5317J-9]UOQ99076.1 hypothetical protein MUN81_06185 [Hymenobacter sp. 5317J-9]
MHQVSLAASLGMSQSEVSASLRRSRVARLVAQGKSQVHPQALLEFLCYGLRYVFPAEPGPIHRGMPTAHSAPPLKQLIRSQDVYVWPSPDGEVRGETITPLYPSVPAAARQDAILYSLLALVDALRVGRAREIALAQDWLKKYLLHGRTT